MLDENDTLGKGVGLFGKVGRARRINGHLRASLFDPLRDLAVDEGLAGDLLLEAIGGAGLDGAPVVGADPDALDALEVLEADEPVVAAHVALQAGDGQPDDGADCVLGAGARGLRQAAAVDVAGQRHQKAAGEGVEAEGQLHRLVVEAPADAPQRREEGPRRLGGDLGGLLDGDMGLRAMQGAGWRLELVRVVGDALDGERREARGLADGGRKQADRSRPLESRLDRVDDVEAAEEVLVDLVADLGRQPGEEGALRIGNLAGVCEQPDVQLRANSLPSYPRSIAVEGVEL